MVLCVLGFAGFMRTDEMLNLKIECIKFHKGYMTVFIPSSKTDQDRNGHTIHISAVSSLCCPVLILKNYIKLAGLKTGDYVIYKIVKTKKGHNVVGRHKLSYSRMRAVFLEFTITHSDWLRAHV